MVFGFDPVKVAKAELKKLDFDHDGKPDALEALDAAEAGLKFLADFIGEISQDEAYSLLVFFNSFRKQGNQWSKDKLAALAKEVVGIPAALRKAAAVLDSVEKQL